MNDKMFCFIACVNDEDMYKESLFYIQQLDIPQGFSIECIAIRNARFMTSGYNAAMKESNAKYKIYMHQDVLILNKRILFDLLNIFQSDEAIGIVGMAGSADIPDTSAWWENEHLLGYAYDCLSSYTRVVNHSIPEQNAFADAGVVDGLFIATQYDLPWREDLFDGWHHYDTSQCCEFLRNNLRVVVANQLTSDGTPKPWCLHYIEHTVTTVHYEKYRIIFLKEYRELIKSRGGTPDKELPGISVIFLFENSIDTIWERMNEIERYASKDSYELIIGVRSIDNKLQQLMEQDGIKVLLTDPQEGSAAFLNRAIKMSKKTNDIMLMNNRIALTGSISVALQSTSYIDDDTGALYCTEGETLPDIWQQSNKLESGFTLFKRTALDRAGFFDEQFLTINYAVNDRAIKLKSLGYKILKRNIPGFAFKSNDCISDLDADKIKYNEKWGSALDTSDSAGDSI